MKKVLSNLLNNEKGSVLLIFVFFMVAVTGLLALSIDFGYYYVEKSRMQNAVDAAALAGASKLPESGLAESTAKTNLTLNGFSDENLDISFEKNNMIIGVKKENAVPTFFAKALGKESFSITTSAKAEKIPGSMGGPFDYLLFSGDDKAKITLGGKFTINGSVHSNGSLSASPSKGVITGSAEACDKLEINKWTTTVGTEVPNAEFIEMVDFSGVIEEMFPSSFTTVLTAKEVNKEWRKQTFNGNTKITGNTSISNQAIVNGFLYVEGDLTINGGTPVCVLNGTIYTTGKLTFNNSINCYGNVFAGENITFNGGSSNFYAINPVCIYSENGDISLNAGNSTVTGIVYAPNGNISIVGGDTIFYGSIIGDTISGIPANLVIGPPDEPFEFLPESSPSIKLIQ
jgi:cytoskeletal protein CcmA (bactofilin family)